MEFPIYVIKFQTDVALLLLHSSPTHITTILLQLYIFSYLFVSFSCLFELNLAVLKEEGGIISTVLAVSYYNN